MTRRAALRKLGITSNMAFFSLFAVDDLARMAIKQMRQNEAMRDIAETVAREFKDSGIVLAQTARKCGDDTCDQCATEYMTWNCTCPPSPEGGSCSNCAELACKRCYGTASNGGFTVASQQCYNRVAYSSICTSKPD